MKYIFPLLVILLLLSFAPVKAQENSTDRHRWLQEGWAIGVGGLAACSRPESPGLDEFYDLHDFEGYTPSPFRISTGILVAWPKF